MMVFREGLGSRLLGRRAALSSLLIFALIHGVMSRTYAGDTRRLDFPLPGLENSTQDGINPPERNYEQVIDTENQPARLSVLDEDEELPPLFPLTAEDYVGLISATLGLMIAAGGGIGGGGILIPCYVILLDFPLKHAISLTSVTVFGGAVANNLINYSKKHPDHPDRSCIDWLLILQLEPATMAGALIGAHLNNVLPDVFLVIMMIMLLSFTAYKTLQRARILYEKETSEMIRVNEHKSLLEPNEESNLVDYGTSTEPTLADSVGEHSVFDAWTSPLKLAGLFCVVTTINLMKGGPEDGGGPVGLRQCGSLCFWVAEGSLLVIILAFSFVVRASLLARLQSGERLLSDIAWNEENTMVYPALAIVAGLAAGLFGVGGGIIKGPLMLSLGVHPVVASATSACMILFTSSTATVSYSVFGFLAYDYAIACSILGFVATVLGQTVMNAIMKHYQRHSLVAYCIGLVVAVSAVCMTFQSFYGACFY